MFIVLLGFCIGLNGKTNGKLFENQSQPTPGPLRSFLLSLSLLWPPRLLWLALAVSFLSLASSTRDKEEIRRWGLSEASFWASPSSVSSLTQQGRNPSLGPLRSFGLGPLPFLFHALRREENTVWAALDLPFSISPTQPALGLLLRDFP